MRTVKKVLLLLTVSVLFIASAIGENEQYITNGQLAYMVFNVAGLTMPESTANLNKEESYKIMADMLNDDGVHSFLGLAPDSSATYELLTNVVYELSGEVNALSFEERNNFLISKGYMTAMPKESFVSIGYANKVLTDPAFAELISEDYSLPLEQLYEQRCQDYDSIANDILYQEFNHPED